MLYSLAKGKKEDWQISQLEKIYVHFLCSWMCFFFFPMLWSACGLTITKWHRTPLRIIFWMLWRWEEHQQVTYFPGQPCSAIAERKEADTKERWEGGEKEDVRGQGQMSRSQREKHIAFHQLAEREVIHNSADTIWPWMCVWGVRSRHAVTGRQVKKRKKCHFPPRLSNSSGEKVILDDKIKRTHESQQKSAVFVPFTLASASGTNSKNARLI